MMGGWIDKSSFGLVCAGLIHTFPFSTPWIKFFFGGGWLNRWVERIPEKYVSSQYRLYLNMLQVTAIGQ